MNSKSEVVELRNKLDKYKEYSKDMQKYIDSLNVSELPIKSSTKMSLTMTNMTIPVPNLTRLVEDLDSIIDRMED